MLHELRIVGLFQVLCIVRQLELGSSQWVLEDHCLLEGGDDLLSGEL